MRLRSYCAWRGVSESEHEESGSEEEQSGEEESGGEDAAEKEDGEHARVTADRSATL